MNRFKVGGVLNELFSGLACQVVQITGESWGALGPAAVPPWRARCKCSVRGGTCIVHVMTRKDSRWMPATETDIKKGGSGKDFSPTKIRTKKSHDSYGIKVVQG